MAQTKTIYVREEDVEMWSRVTELADEVGVPVSGVVARALREYLPVLAGQAEKSHPR